MAERSMYDRGGDGLTAGGLDSFLAPPAMDMSSLPPSIEDPAHPAEPERAVDCDGADKGEPVCEIAEAERARGT